MERDCWLEILKMSTKAYFDNIKDCLINELNNASSSILVAIAWFTDKELFDILCSKIKEGLNVELIITYDEINISSSFEYQKMNQIGGSFKYYEGSLMHNKFCIIDLKTTITGSYNWSYQSKHNRENISVTQDSALALQFAKYFYMLKYGTHIHISELSEKELTNLIYYIQEIKKQIESNEFEKIDSSVFLLKNLNYVNNDIFIISKLLENHQWTQALLVINNYLKSNQQLAIYEDLELRALNFHKESLEVKLYQLILHKNDLERRIHQFTIEYNQKLGDLLIELIELKRQYNLDFTGAFNKDKQKVDEARKTKIRDLNENDNQNLKKVYKKAVLLCHPDKIDVSMKAEAEEIFKTLNTAYKNNDIEEVNRIFLNISNNNFLIRKKTYDSRSITQKEIERLIYKINKIKFDINKIRLSPYNSILEKVHDWDLFYSLEREKIINEINEIKNEFTKKNIFKKKQRQK